MREGTGQNRERREKEERDKKLAKEQYKKDNSHKGFIKKLKDGYFGLAITFWIFGVVGIFVLAIMLMLGFKIYKRYRTKKNEE